MQAVATFRLSSYTLNKCGEWERARLGMGRSIRSSALKFV